MGRIDKYQTVSSLDSDHRFLVFKDSAGTERIVSWANVKADALFPDATRWIQGILMTTWTTRASAADNQWRSVTWSPELGLFCAVAYTGSGNRVMTTEPCPA